MRFLFRGNLLLSGFLLLRLLSGPRLLLGHLFCGQAINCLGKAQGLAPDPGRTILQINHIGKITKTAFKIVHLQIRVYTGACKYHSKT